MISIQHEKTPPATLDVFTKATVDDGTGTGTHITKAAYETREAIRFFTHVQHYANDKKLTKEKFKFEIYKDPQLSAYLEQKFKRKCGYCESEMAHVTPKDVDHYRPKSSIECKEYRYFPGYYWLGANWDNLIVSCPRCNRPGTHELGTGAQNISQGKASQFPLTSEAARVRAHTGNLQNENDARLLLNPYIDNPEDHLYFDELGLIYSKETSDGTPSKKGEKSIEVYALQRKALVEKRRERLANFEFLICQVEHLLSIHHDLNNHASKARNEGEIQRIMDKMASFFKPEAPYLAMLRHYVGAPQNAPRLGELKRKTGVDLALAL